LFQGRPFQPEGDMATATQAVVEHGSEHSTLRCEELEEEGNDLILKCHNHIASMFSLFFDFLCQTVKAFDLLTSINLVKFWL
jgi:hypothetical protein